MGKTGEYSSSDALGLAELVRKKEAKPTELVDAAIERIERLNPTLNAVITPFFEQARKAAAGDLPRGPFTGVPFLLKDIGATLGGVRMTMGTAFLKDFVPDHDSELVSRLKRAGFIIVGKTSTPELGILPTTESRFLGRTRNPWNLDRTTGGSSGGAASAVAAGIVPAAHANDGGGSIRIPASCCGVFGLKPTRARNPLGPDLGDMFGGLIAEHAVTRSVRDSAAILDATAGPDIGDPYWAPPPARPFLQEVGADPGKLRMAFTASGVEGLQIHPDCTAAVKDAAKLCADLGHEVEEAALPVNRELIKQAFMVLWTAGCAWTIDGLALAARKTPSPDQFEPLTWALYEIGKKHSASTYLLSLTLLQKIARDLARATLKYDVWITPTLAEPPVPLGTFDSPPENPLHGYRRAETFVPFTPLCNITGQPAMSVPLFWNQEGLPVGTHFIGRFGDEATLFRLAAQLEAARPWAGRRPPVCA
ncbi:MAG: amidase [Deltaproteobacteria bacterium SM23_61]|nr:MAG: amidase [Deltaproteobacteria bacterium SM23_61]